MLQERLYIVDSVGPSWRVRLSPLDRPLSLHDTEDEALEAARNAGRRWAPARIRVIHSGHPVTEWSIRYPDGEWQEQRLSPLSPPGEDGFSGGHPTAG